MDKEKKELKIIVPEKIQAPLYSNVAQINVTDREVSLNFAYFEPNTDQGVMVSKIILTHDHAKELIATLGGTLEKHYAGKKSK